MQRILALGIEKLYACRMTKTRRKGDNFVKKSAAYLAKLRKADGRKRTFCLEYESENGFPAQNAKKDLPIPAGREKCAFR